MNERLRILKLLEEGKINAEEAARLLEALNGGESRKRHLHSPHFSFWHTIENIPEMVSSAMASAFKHVSVVEKLEYGKKQKISIRGVSGDIEIQGADVDNITIDKEGLAKVMENEDTLEIKTISGDMSIILPRSTLLEIKGVSGDVQLKGLDSMLEIASVDGDIEGKDLSGSMKINVVSGDVDLQYKQIDNIEINAKTGDIVLRLSRDIAAEIEVQTGEDEGDIECEFELKDKIEKENYLKGIINKARGKIQIKNDYGDVSILRK